MGFIYNNRLIHQQVALLPIKYKSEQPVPLFDRGLIVPTRIGENTFTFNSFQRSIHSKALFSIVFYLALILSTNCIAKFNGEIVTSTTLGSQDNRL